MTGEAPPTSRIPPDAASPIQPLRDWIDYFRDLGVYDLYRFANAAASAHDQPSDPLLPATQLSPVPTSPAPLAIAPGPSPFIAPPASPAQPLPQPHSARSSAITLPTRPEPPVPPLVSFDQLAPLPAPSIPPADRAANLQAIQNFIGDCTRCPLAYAGRRNIVFGDGSPTARLMFIGEGPGADEDTQGIPFVGKAGQLLNNMIAAMGLQRSSISPRQSEVYIANIVKCRPPANRVPEPVEATTCSQFLLRQIDTIQPQVIVALGSTAATYLLGVKRPLTALRGQWHSCRGAKLAVTYHPAFLLRDPRMKAEAWKDLQMVMAELNLTPPARKAD